MTDITLDAYYMGRKSTYLLEWNNTIEDNAIELLRRVNALLHDLKWEGSTAVSSGWRPPSLNAKVPHAAKGSAHQTGQAVDIADVNQILAKELLAKPELLAKYDLYMENPNSTKGVNGHGWVHLQTRHTLSGNRVFNP